MEDAKGLEGKFPYYKYGGMVSFVFLKSEGVIRRKVFRDCVLMRCDVVEG